MILHLNVRMHFSSKNCRSACTLHACSYILNRVLTIRAHALYLRHLCIRGVLVYVCVGAVMCMCVRVCVCVCTRVHTNSVVRYEDVFLHEQASKLVVCIVMEFCEKGDLAGAIGHHRDRRTPIPERQLLKWLHEMFEARSTLMREFLRTCLARASLNRH